MRVPLKCILKDMLFLTRNFPIVSAAGLKYYYTWIFNEMYNRKLYSSDNTLSAVLLLGFGGLCWIKMIAYQGLQSKARIIEADGEAVFQAWKAFVPKVAAAGAAKKATPEVNVLLPRGAHMADCF